MTDPRIPQEATTDEAHELVALEQQVSALADPRGSADAIADELDYLYTSGANAEALEVVHGEAAALVENCRQLDQAFQGALGIARRIQQQRDQTRATLDELRTAIDTCDVSVPEIEEMAEAIEEMVIETQEMALWEIVADLAVDNIVAATGLSWTEGERLFAILTDGPLHAGDALWDELREWIEKVEEAASLT